MPSGVSTGCLTVTRVQWVQPFSPAHNLIIPQPRSSLLYRRRIHNLVVHQRRSPLPCRHSILLRRPASLHRSRTAAPGGARGLALLRNPQGCHRGLSVSFFFVSGFSFSFVLFFVFFVFFETPRLHSQNLSLALGSGCEKYFENRCSLEQAWKNVSTEFYILNVFLRSARTTGSEKRYKTNRMSKESSRVHVLMTFF